MTTAAVHLTTGWEPDLPDEDSLCLRWVRHWADQCAAMAAAAGGTVVRDERLVLADHGRPASWLNSVVLLAPPPPDGVDALLDEIEARAVPELHLWSLWPLPDLRPRGWELDGHPPLLVRPPGPVPVAPAAASGGEPQRVRTAADLAAWEGVLVEGYPLAGVDLDRPGALIGPALLDDERFRFWSSAEDGRVQAISAQFVAHGLASFALGVTLPGARRRGLWARHARLRLRTEPDRWHVGVFSDDSRPGAEQLGFTPLLRHALWHRPR